MKSKGCYASGVWLVVATIVVLGLFGVAESSGFISTRKLLAQKQEHLKSVQASLNEVETLIRADKVYPKEIKLSGYGSLKKRTMDELLEVLKTVEYEVDILSKLCLENLGPNCDGKMNETTQVVKTAAPLITASSITVPRTERVLGAVDSEDIVVDVRMPDGSAAKTCKEYLKHNSKLQNGVYFIKPFNDEPEFKVFCDMKNGGYILFQRRIDGKVDFLRKWKDYAEGFGDQKTSYWLGLKTISKFTKTFKSSLRVYLYHNTRKHNFFAKYKTFSVDPENKGFTLHVAGYSGDLGDSLTYHTNRKFSTVDRDNDGSASNCAQAYKGAFWYHSCHLVNLNGAYLKGAHTTYADGINWQTHSGYHYSFEKSAMGMIEE